MLNVDKDDLNRHREPTTLSDRVAIATARAMASVAAVLFGRRYGDRVVVLEHGRKVIDDPAGALTANDLLRHFGGEP